MEDAGLAARKRRARISAKQARESREESKREADRTKLLLPQSSGGGIQVETDIERTWKAKQRDILQDADDNTLAKVVDLKLNSSYVARFTKNGRHLVVGGKHNGHLALIDALRSTLISEITLDKEEVHDVTPLHNETLYAVCQRKYLYVYDRTGTEIHQLRSHIEPRKVEFLPYHYLLATVGRNPRVVYHDISTGQMVASLRTKLGPCSVMAQNPQTALIASGHLNGVVAMWAPSNGDALVKVLCHQSPVTAMSYDASGNYMVTAGIDGRMKVWDVRNLGVNLNSYFVRPPKHCTALSISDTGKVAMATNRDEITIWGEGVFHETKQMDPYLSFRLPSGTTSCSLHFRPYEDILGIGYTQGVRTIVVPGAGRANFDAYEDNPFERKFQRRETEVKKLLDKLPADTIGLEQIGGLFTSGLEKGMEKQQQVAEARRDPSADDGEPESIVAVSEENDGEKPQRSKKERHKMKGRSKIGRKLKVKHDNIVTIEREKTREALERRAEQERKKPRTSPDSTKTSSDEPGSMALARLAKPSKKQSH